MVFILRRYPGRQEACLIYRIFRGLHGKGLIRWISGDDLDEWITSDSWLACPDSRPVAITLIHSLSRGWHWDWSTVGYETWSHPFVIG